MISKIGLHHISKYLSCIINTKSTKEVEIMSGMTAKARIKLTNALQVLLGPPVRRGGGGGGC